MNIHVIQTIEAQIEARLIANVKNCMMSTATGRPTMGIIMDAVISAYRLVESKVQVEPSLWFEAVELLTNRDSLGTLEERLRYFHVPRFSGKSLFSTLLPENFFYSGGDVLILNGILISGRITKKHIGTSAGSIIHALWKDYGPERTADFLTDASYLLNYWITETGFSIKLTDCIPVDKDHKKRMEEKINTARLKFTALGGELKDPAAEIRREKDIQAALDTTKAVGDQIATQSLPADSSLLQEVESGTKGDLFNLAQITGVIGQQMMIGGRMPPTLLNRTRASPYYPPEKDPRTGETVIAGLTPEARGFCTNSFLTGVSPSELFWLQAGGRVGLMDTANKTAETGYFHHRILKALEDLTIYPDGSVRNVAGVVVQYIYGNDGLNPAGLETVKANGYEFPSFINVKRTVNRINAKYGYYPDKSLNVSQKIVLMGPGGVGKTTSVNNLKGEILDSEYVSTADIVQTNVRLDGNLYNIWEIPAGLESVIDWNIILQDTKHAFIFKPYEVVDLSNYTTILEGQNISYTILNPPFELGSAIIDLTKNTE